MSTRKRAKASSDRAEFAALAPARREAYRFLSGAFSEPPSAEALETLRSSAFLKRAARLFGEKAAAHAREFAAAGAEVPELARQARQEFVNLFTVPGPQYVTPYESVFRDTREVAGRQVKGLLMGRSAIDVQKWYRLAALEIADEYKDLPDHICIELHYLAHLCAKEQEFASGNQEARLIRAWEMERDFLAAHIVSWAGELRDAIHSKTQHAYFRAVADMMVEFTRRDLATLEGLLGKSRGTSAPDYDGPAS